MIVNLIAFILFFPIFVDDIPRSSRWKVYCHIIIFTLCLVNLFLYYSNSFF